METVEGGGPGAAWCGHAKLDVRHVGPPCRFRFPAAGDHRWTCAPFTEHPNSSAGIKLEKIVLLLWRFLAWRNCGGQKDLLIYVLMILIWSEDADQITLDVQLLMLSAAATPSPLHADRSHGRPCVMQVICATPESNKLKVAQLEQELQQINPSIFGEAKLTTSKQDRSAYHGGILCASMPVSIMR